MKLYSICRGIRFGIPLEDIVVAAFYELFHDRLRLYYKQMLFGIWGLLVEFLKY